MNDHWQTVLAIDFDKWAAETYRANFPAVRVECGRVGDFLDTMPECDVLLGGPPCQPHSLSGKRKASADDRDGGDDFVAGVRKSRCRQFLEQDAVNFGVPQFRKRLWVWGIRRDLYVNGVRHAWPNRTHSWPPPTDDPDLFGLSAALHYLPGVTVGEALGLDGTVQRGQRGTGIIERHGDRGASSTREPSPMVGNGENGSNRLFIQSHADPAQTVHRPAPTLHSGGDGHDGCCLRLHVRDGAEFVGIRRAAGPNSQQAKYGHTYTADEPAPTVNAMGKGGSDGLEAVIRLLNRPSPTIIGGSASSHTNGLSTVNDKVFREAFKSAPPTALGSGPWKHKGELWVRRLSPLECARLQSVPDSFVWPEGIMKTAAYRIVGNGWASGHAAHFSRALAAADPESRMVVDLFCGGGLGACGWHQRHWSYTPEEGETQCA